MSLTERTIKPALQPVAPRESPSPPCRNRHPRQRVDQRCLLTVAHSYESHGFEGFCRLTIQPQFDDAAIANSAHYGRVRVHSYPRQTPPVEGVGDDDRLTVLDDLQRLDHHALERLEKRVPEAPRRVLAPVDPCLK